MRNTLIALGLLLLLPGVARAASWPPRPDGVREFVSDGAKLLGADDLTAVNGVCRALLAERGIPVIVVTIPMLRSYGGGTIEAYARALFDHWGLGTPDRNLGILLLVAVVDRKARIELGAGWGRDHDDDADYVLQQLLIPRFKRGQMSRGIREAVVGLDAMARGAPLPSRAGGFPIPREYVVIGILGLALLIVVFFYMRSPARRYGRNVLRLTGRRPRRRHVRPRRGSWRRAQARRDRRNAIAGHRGLGGFGGSSGFGGGFSGGGGATGGW